MNVLIMAEPISTVETFVVSTGRRAKVRMLTSGCGVRRSKTPKRTSTTSPKALSPRVRAEPQSRSAAREMPISRAVRPMPRMAAPARSTRPGVRTGDAGTKRWVVSVARMRIVAATQKIQW
jgi:hypothetical protein